MTVCISVACDCYKEGKAPKLALVSDTLLSMGITSTRTLKVRGLGKNWSVMLAGDDISYAENVIGHAAHEVEKTGTYISPAAACAAMLEAYQEARRALIEQTYLSTYGWTMADFLQQGPDVPTPAHRQYLLSEMEKFDLGCQFLVSGFSAPTAKAPTIFEIHSPGRVVPQGLLGYSAIGSGSINAITYLAWRSQNYHTSLEQSLYNAIAAKRLAEKAAGVGRETSVIILERGNEEPDFLSRTQVNDIATMWLTEEASVQPKDLEKRVSSILSPPAQPTVKFPKPVLPTEP